MCLLPNTRIMAKGTRLTHTPHHTRTTRHTLPPDMQARLHIRMAGMTHRGVHRRAVNVEPARFHPLVATAIPKRI